MQWQFQQFGFSVVIPDCREQRIPGLGVVKRFSDVVDGRDTFEGKYHRGGSGRAGGPLGNLLAQVTVLLDRGSHQCHRRVVFVEQPVGESGGDIGRGSEVDHVGGADTDHLGDSTTACGGEAIGPGRENATDQFVGQLGGGDVEDPGDQAIVDQRLHRLAPVAGGVEDQHLEAGFLQPLFCSLHARGGDTKHGCSDEPTVVGGVRGRCEGDQSGHGAGGRIEHAAADAVEAENVDDRVEHQEIGVADPWSNLATGQCAHHQLGQSQRKRSHGTGGDCRPGRSTNSDHPLQLAGGQFRGGQRSGCLGGGGNGPAAVAVGHECRQRCGTQPVELVSGDVRGDRWMSQAAGVDDLNVDAQFRQPVAEKGRFGALRVERGQQQDGHGRDQPMMSAMGLPLLMKNGRPFWS